MTGNAGTEEDGWKPPYLSYVTFTNFIDKKCDPVPPELDKVFLESVAGGIQPLLLTAMKQVGLLKADGRTVNKEKLADAASSVERRKSHLREWAEEFYAEQLLLARNKESSQKLYDSFDKSGYTDSTHRKAVVFFLNLVKDVDLPISPFFKPPKQVTAKKKGTSTKSSRGQDRDDDRGDDRPPHDPDEGAYEFIVGSAGTIRISVDLDLLALNKEKAWREKVFKLLDLLDDFDQATEDDAGDEDDDLDEDGDL